MSDDSSKTASLGAIESVPIDHVRPYWRNPRRVTEESVNMLVRSIEEFGYQQPIVVDSDYVIIVGHTRYAALRRMKREQVEVMIATDLSPEAVKQYRLIDNKVSELTSWDMDALTSELEAIDNDMLRAFFPFIAREGDEAPVTQAAQDAETLEREWSQVDSGVEFTCPACFHSWEQPVSKTDVMSGRIALIARPEETSRA
jgi:hypothetical protein